MLKNSFTPVTLALLSFLLLFLSGCSTAPRAFCPDGSNRCLKNLVGTYRGEIHNGGMGQPALTSFYFNDKGQMVGKYFMNSDKDAVMGEIVEFVPVGDYLAVLKWKDPFSTGHLRAMFSYDGSQFTGQWGVMSKLDSFPWNGFKTSNTPTTLLENQVEIEKQIARDQYIQHRWEETVLKDNDLDKDGTISLAEHEEVDIRDNNTSGYGAALFFCQYDINNDLRVDFKEYFQAKDINYSIPVNQYCNYKRSLDYDNDGIFTLVEYEKDPTNFDRARLWEFDLNEDQKVTRVEIFKYFSDVLSRD